MTSGERKKERFFHSKNQRFSTVEMTSVGITIPSAPCHLERSREIQRSAQTVITDFSMRFVSLAESKWMIIIFRWLKDSRKKRSRPHCHPELSRRVSKIRVQLKLRKQKNKNPRRSFDSASSAQDDKRRTEKGKIFPLQKLKFSTVEMTNRG